LQAQVQVGPNPFSHQLSVALSAQLGSPVFRLYDAAGRVVQEQSVNLGINELSTHSLPPGLYLWELVSRGERVKVGKLVKF
jgi:Secretion system C-terminal sorting domain